MSVKHLTVGIFGIGGLAVLGAATFALASGDDLPGSRDQTRAGMPTPSAEELAGLYAVDTSPYQAAVLADGTVTDEEMEAAVRATVTCLRGQGLNAEFLAQTQLWAPPSFRIVSSEPPELTAEQVVACKETYMSDLGLPYAFELERRHAVFSREEAAKRTEKCLVTKGFALTGDYTSYYDPGFQAELSQTPGAGKAFQDCLAEVQFERFPGTPGP